MSYQRPEVEIDPGQGLLEAEQQRLVGGVEIGAGYLGRVEVGDAAGLHELQGLGDPARHVAVALALRRPVEKAHGPLMDARQRGVAALGEGPEQVQGRRRLAVGLDLAERIGPARHRVELEAVDDVAAIGRQLDPAHRLGRRRAGLGELAGDPADLHHRQAGAEGEHDRHLQEHPQRVPYLVGVEIGEGLGAVAALQQKGLAGGDVGELVLEGPRLAGEDERRKGGEPGLDLGQRLLVLVVRHLTTRRGAPAARMPIPTHARLPHRAGRLRRPADTSSRIPRPRSDGARRWRRARPWWHRR